MKNLVNNFFDNIKAVITNSREDIDIDIMNINKKTSKSILFIPSYPLPISQKGENYSVLENKNKKDIE